MGLRARATACASLTLAACVPGTLRFPPTATAIAAGETAVLASERDVEPHQPRRVRFAAIGDIGEPRGLAVTRAAAEACWGDGARPCDFTLLLGDNVYPDGFDGGPAEHGRARSLLERLIAPLTRRPVYAVLGNHDWGWRFPRIATARRQLDWIAAREPRRGAAHFYRFRAAFVEVWVIDTSYLVWRPAAARNQALARWLAEIERSEALWKIVAGHHPYLSAGEHGSAGRYRDGPLRIWPGDALRALLEERVIGRADLYLAGHDHDLQLFTGLGASGRTAAAVVGSGAKCGPRAQRPRDLPVFEHHDYGFAVVEATAERLEITLFDERRRRLAVASREKVRSAWRVERGLVQPRLSCPPDAAAAPCEEEKPGSAPAE